MGFVLEEPVRVTRRVQVVGVLVLLVLVVAAVLTWRATRPNYDPATAARTAAGVTVLVETEDYTGAVGGAGVGGVLTVLPGGCLGVGSGQGPGDGVLLVFPPDTSVRAEAGTFSVRLTGSDGSPVTLRPGDDLSGGTRFGGGPVPVEDYANLVEHTPRACRGYPAMSFDLD